MPIIRRNFLTIALAAPIDALAQDKPVRVILPVSAGSGVDAAARTLAPGVGRMLRQSLVIENMPGAGGITGTQAIAKAPPDGSVIGMVSNNHVVNPSVYRNVPFHAVDDFTPIMVVGALPFVLAAHPSVPARNVNELLALARSKPGSLNYGSSGNGTILHLAGAMLTSEGNVDIKHIPYRGTAQLTNDLLSGQIQLGFLSLSVAAAHVKNNALRALGVTTPQRSQQAPDVPTIAEQGLPNYALDGWFAVIGPGKMPQKEVRRIHSAYKGALAMPEIREKMIQQGYILRESSPDEAQAYFRSEVVRMAKLVSRARVTVD